MSSAHVSDATTNPLGSRPIDRGRTPKGSRAAKTLRSSIITKQKAPLSFGSTCMQASSSPPVSVICCTSSVVTMSESVVAAPDGTMAASSWVLTRLPLCPSASVWAPSVLNTGWALSHVVEPVVEYRVWPIARSPCSVVSVASLKTWLTRPRSLKTRIVWSSLTAMPADSCPRCCWAKRPK